jgi:hypothetical protein
MGPLEIHLNGAASGEGFVIVSSQAQPLSATLSLRTTDSSTGDVTCQPAPGSQATLSFSPATVSVSGSPAEVQVVATTPSGAQNDTTIEVVEGSEVVARFDLSAIEAPRVRFTGRFQLRLATDTDPFDERWGTPASDFRLYAVQGPNETDPNLPPDEPPLDRVIRFQDGEAVRPYCPSIGVGVTHIEADLGGSTLRFAAGDALIGLPVRLGPTCKIEERNGTFAPVGRAPLGDFRFEIGTVFAGASAPAAPPGQPPSNAPRANGIVNLDLPNPPWTPADFGYPEATWQQHATAVTTAKRGQLETQVPANDQEARLRTRRLQEHQGTPIGLLIPLRRMQRYTGELDRELSVAPNSTGALAYLATLPVVQFSADFLDYDSDCQSGTVTGTVGAPEVVAAFAADELLPPGEGRDLRGQRD